MDVLVDRQDDVVVVTLNRVATRNSMNAEMFAALWEAFSEAEATDARVIVTKANGPTFCVGADASDVMSAIEGPMQETFRRDFEGRQGFPALGAESAHAFDTLGFNRWAWAVAHLKTPRIAAVAGAAAGGGLGLALLHHFRIADQNAKFAAAFARLGLGAELGVSYLLPELIGEQAALDMFLTGRVVGADKAQELGLVDQLVQTGGAEQAALDYAETVCATPRLAARAAIEGLVRRREAALLRSMELEWQRQCALWGTEESRAAVKSVMSKFQKS